MLKRNSFIRHAGKAFALSAVVAGTLQAQNVTLQLSNGDQITGQIVLQNTNQVTLSNAWAKAIVIPLAEIKSRKTNAPVAVANAPVAKTNAPAAKPAAAAKPAPKPVVATAPKPAPRPKPDWTKDWHGDVQIGTDVGLGEARRELYYGRFKITYAPVPGARRPATKA